MTRENGELHEHIQYFPFGETWVQQGGNTEKSPYLFTSKELDEETGLYYFGARYYDPRTSVWVSVDPADRFNASSSPLGLNLYQYALWNPMMLIDPDGRAEVNSIFIFDSGVRPKDNGTPGTTYTAIAYVINNDPGGSVSGPYRMSTYSNSKLPPANNVAAHAEIKAKGFMDGGVAYNNKYGHKGGSKKGLNMGTNTSNGGVATLERVVEATGPNPVHNNKSIVTEGNIHSGVSDNGGPQSRGSTACFTVHPDDVGAFMGNFDWNSNNPNTGTSHGNVYTYRGDSTEASMWKSILEQAVKNQD